MKGNVHIVIKWVVFALALTSVNAWAQDLHFSQFYNSPMSLNPANTGFFGGKTRAGGLYKSQWGSVTQPFQTYTAGVDYGILKNSYTKKNQSFAYDWAGIGVNAFNDVAGDGDLSTSKVYVSMAYHKALAGAGKLFLSIGGNFGYVQKSLVFNKLYFGDSWNPDNFEYDQPSGENRPLQAAGYLDYGFGALISFIPKSHNSVFLGYSLNDIGEMKSTFLGVLDTNGMRGTLHGGGSLMIGQRINFDPGFIHMTRQGASELIVGANFGWQIGNNSVQKTKVYLGAWGRMVGDFIGVFGMSWNDIKMQFSYDVNMGKVQSLTDMQGGYEISLVKVWGASDALHCTGF